MSRTGITAQKLKAAADSAIAQALAARHRVKIAKTALKRARKASKLAKKTAKRAIKKLHSAAAGFTGPESNAGPAKIRFVEASAKAKRGAARPRRLASRKSASKPSPSAAGVAQTVIDRLEIERRARQAEIAMHVPRPELESIACPASPDPDAPA